VAKNGWNAGVILKAQKIKEIRKNHSSDMLNN
jgi:hypothetical protein